MRHQARLRIQERVLQQQGEYVLLHSWQLLRAGGYRDRGEKQKYFSGDIPCDFVLTTGDLLVAMTEQAAGLLGSPILVPESGQVPSQPATRPRHGEARRTYGRTSSSSMSSTLSPFERQFTTDASGVKVRHTSPTKIGEVVVAFPASMSEQKRRIVLNHLNFAAESQSLESIYRKSSRRWQN